MTVYKFSNVSGFKNYQKYNDFLAGNPAVILDKGSMYPLGVFTLASSNSAGITFTNIPQTYTHLQIRVFTAITTTARLGLGYNSDTTYSNYNLHYLYGDGSSASSGYVANSNGVGIAQSGSNFGATIVDILDYRNTNKFKVARSLSGQDRNGSGDIIMYSTLWRNTNAITSLTLYPYENSSGGGTFATNSSFALYGVL